MLARLKSIYTKWERRRLIMPRDQLHKFWQQPAPEGNVPENYIGATDRSAGLLALISDLPKTARILEVGCNVGRNLAYLYNAGLRDVTGVEISPHAVALLRETYPELAGCDIHQGSAEEVLASLPDRSFDLVFTMAVLEHIHPKSTVVFDRMAALTDFILAIEQTGASASSRQFPHDIPKLFSDRGFTLTRKVAMWDVPETKNDRALRSYSAYFFRR